MLERPRHACQRNENRRSGRQQWCAHHNRGHCRAIASARGAATLYKFRGRDLITRQKVDFVLKGTDNLPEADFHKRVVKMMYKDAEAIHLLDQEDFNHSR